MNLETKITIYKFTPQVFTLTLLLFAMCHKTNDTWKYLFQKQHY